MIDMAVQHHEKFVTCPRSNVHMPGFFDELVVAVKPIAKDNISITVNVILHPAKIIKLTKVWCF